MIMTFLGLILLAGLAIFQAFLIVGKPFGEYAWGGQHKVLTKELRIASVSSIILYVVFALFLASRAGLIPLIASPAVVIGAAWLFTGYFFLGVVMNLISRSKKERIVMTPVALLLALSFLSVSL